MKVFDPKKHDFRPEPGKPEASPNKREGEAGKPLDEALEDTFPASDPPAITTPRKRERRPS